MVLLLLWACAPLPPCACAPPLRAASGPPLRDAYGQSSSAKTGCTANTSGNGGYSDRSTKSLATGLQLLGQTNVIAFLALSQQHDDEDAKEDNGRECDRSIIPFTSCAGLNRASGAYPLPRCRFRSRKASPQPALRALVSVSETIEPNIGDDPGSGDSKPDAQAALCHRIWLWLRPCSVPTRMAKTFPHYELHLRLPEPMNAPPPTDEEKRTRARRLWTTRRKLSSLILSQLEIHSLTAPQRGFAQRKASGGCHGERVTPHRLMDGANDSVWG